ncbi:MAG: alpha-galactosidase [Bryobacteraceae bacterium]|nr:alpha-galactosidase [Bryobacteraceae bacterium]
MEFSTTAAHIRVETGAPQWWSYQPPTGRRIEFSGPSFEIDGQAVSDSLSDLQPPAAPRRLATGVSEYRVEARLNRHPSLHATLIFRLAPDNPVVRFRYELYSTSGEKLTRASGRDCLDYGAVSLAALPVVREVRFSEFQEATHSFTLSERQIEARDFDNGLRLMGPLVAASDSRNALLLAYEHGSQAPDAFLEFRLAASRELRLQAVKGNYWNGQPLTPERPWRSVWMHAAVVEGDIDALASAYRTFLLRYQSEAAESRKPYVFYNTWNFQERNKWWYGKPYLESMNEQRILKEIDIAHAMGIDVFVLDTGWYEKTGDWQVSRKRFPNGLEPIRARLDSYGMKLGLWFNPTAAALSSRMYASQQASVVTRDGVAGKPFEVWETEASQSMCLVSDYADAFADKLIEVAHQTGARYFKWDAIGQYGCNSGNHHHGTAANTAAERTESFAFQLPLYMARIAERLSAAVPDAIVDFDITEGGRAVGLSFLSAGKYFLINNGPYKFNYDQPMDLQKENWNLFFFPGPARTWICRTPLTFDKWIPSVLFLTHYLPDDPLGSQSVNFASLILGQDGIWGDLPRISPAGVSFWGEALRHYKQVRDDMAASAPLRSGSVGGTPEIHEKIAPSGRGGVVLFATAPGEFTYVTHARAVHGFWQSGPATVEFDSAGRARIRARLDKPGALVVLFGATQ